MWSNFKQIVQEVADIPNHIKEVTQHDVDVETPEEYSKNTYETQLDETSLALEK
jgi:chromosome segregation ATPase